jgi:hypothetical protein
MLIVVDNVLDADSLQVVQSYFAEEAARQMRWVDGDFEKLLGYKSALSQILSQAARAFDLSAMVGVEQWAHYGTKPDWHVDKDEVLFKRTGELACPICSIVFYANIDELIGGNFMMLDAHIAPKTNRMVAFGPNVLHGVESYAGTRMSVAVNPWANKPEGY